MVPNESKKKKATPKNASGSESGSASGSGEQKASDTNSRASDRSARKEEANSTSLPSQPTQRDEEQEQAQQAQQAQQRQQRTERKRKRTLRDGCFVQHLQQLDECYSAHFDSARRTEAYTAAALRRPSPAPPTPFHHNDDNLAATLLAIGKICGIEPQEFTCGSDPREVYDWCWKTIYRFGLAMREEGRNMERNNVGLPFCTARAEQVFRLMLVLEKMLTNRNHPR